MWKFPKLYPQYNTGILFYDENYLLFLHLKCHSTDSAQTYTVHVKFYFKAALENAKVYIYFLFIIMNIVLHQKIISYCLLFFVKTTCVKNFYSTWFYII